MPRKPRKKIKEIAKSVLPEKNAPHVAGGVSVFLSVAFMLQIILFLLHFMIYETVVAAFGLGGFVPPLILGLLSLTFISASFLSAVAGNAFVRAYYRLAAIWFSFVAPLCGACAAFIVVENLFPLWGWIIVPSAAGAVCFGGAIVISLYGIWNSSHFRVTRIAVPLPNVPDAWRGKRLVFFSDVHLGDVRAEGFAKKIVKKVRILDPSVVLIGGDLFDGVKCDAEKLIAPFRELRPPRGVYFVSGNHEYIRDREIFLGAVRNAGITILHNEKVDLAGIDLIGVDWDSTDKKENFAAILEHMDIAKGRPNILLRHVPDDLGIAERAGVLFQLSGHTHRGQFWPLSLATRYFYKGFDYGFHYFGKMAIYISSGIGTWMSPFRFGTKAEIVVIEFK
jgi:predicted MPP superfamily phosphohydrolase